MVDCVVDSIKFELGIRHVKSPCVAFGIEKGKQMARSWLAGNCLGFYDSDVAAQFVDAMYVAISAFSETDFASYIRLGELGLDDIRQLCSKEEEHVPDSGVGGAASTQPHQG